MSELGDDSIYFNKNTIDSERYFQLFDKYIPVFDKTSNILIFSISNPVTIMRMMEKNPGARYIIVDEKETFSVVQLLVNDRDFECVYINIDDFDWYNISMKFDCVIMNPPYSRNLHLKILDQAIKQLKDNNSVIVNLSPVRWLQDPLADLKSSSDFYKFNHVFKKIKSLKTISSKDATNLFGGEGNTTITLDLGIYKITNNNSNTIDHRVIKNNIDFTNVFKKIDFSFKNINIEKFSKRQNNNYVLLISIGGMRARGIPATECIKDKYGYFINDLSDGKILAEKKASNKRSVHGNINDWIIRSFKTKQETINFFNTSRSLFFRFCCYISTSDVHVQLQFLPWVDNYINPRTGLKGYKSEWTNEDFYQFFNITPEEQKVIEDTMKQYM